MSEKIVENLVETIQKTINGEITIINILSICLDLMRLVVKIPNLKGSEKKDLVLRSLNLLLVKTNSDSKLIQIIPYFIDKCIDIEKGSIRISVPQSCCFF